MPLFAFPPAIRKMIYTTNAVESLNRSLRKIIKTRGSFPTDEAALKLLFLAIRNAGVHWRRPIEWTAAVGQFAILFGDRFEPSARWRLKTKDAAPLIQRFGHSLGRRPSFFIECELPHTRPSPKSVIFQAIDPDHSR